MSKRIEKAKESYYRSKVEGLRNSHPAKWYRIYELVVADDSQSSNLPAEAISDLAERLQYVFTKPWQDTAPTEVPDINTVISLLKDSSSSHTVGKLSKELAPVVHDIMCASIVQCKYPELYKLDGSPCPFSGLPKSL